MRRLLLVLVLLVAACGGGHPPAPAERLSLGPSAPIPWPALPSALGPALTAQTAWYQGLVASVPVEPPQWPQEGRVGSAVVASTDPPAGPGLPCGGSLPPCWVLDRESGYNDGDPYTYDIHAYNPSGCGGRGCRGKWQCDPRSCTGTGTEEQQDAEARDLWNGGEGCANWGACG